MSTYINPNTGHLFRIDSLPIPSFAKEYLHYIMGTRGMTSSTVAKYYTRLLEFLRWTQGRDTPMITADTLTEIDVSTVPFSVIEGIRKTDIYEYLSFCAEILKNNEATRNGKLSTLKSFFTYYTLEMSRLANNPALGIITAKKPKPQPKYLTEAECRDLLVQIHNYPATEFPTRDYCMLVFFLCCGMRISELVGINIRDIRETQLTLFGKGRKEREVWLNAACMDALAEYLEERKTLPHASDEPALFISRRTGRRITDRWVREIIDKMFVAAGYGDRGFTPHKLRHSAATLFLKGGADIMEVKEILGHESTSTTQIYLHLANQEIKRVMETSPLATFDPDKEGSHNEG